MCSDFTLKVNFSPFKVDTKNALSITEGLHGFKNIAELCLHADIKGRAAVKRSQSTSKPY